MPQRLHRGRLSLLAPPVLSIATGREWSAFAYGNVRKMCTPTLCGRTYRSGNNNRNKLGECPWKRIEARSINLELPVRHRDRYRRLLTDGRRSLTFMSRLVFFEFSSTFDAFLMSGTRMITSVFPPSVGPVQYM